MASNGINYMDLIMNPEKHGLGGQQKNAPVQKTNYTAAPSQPIRQGVLPKETVIPSNVDDAKLNEWQQQQQQRNQSKKSSDIKENQKTLAQQTNEAQKTRQDAQEQVQQQQKIQAKQSANEVSQRNVGGQKEQQGAPEKNVGRSNSNKESVMSKQERLRMQYSLKEESKQDYKRIFQSVVKEYRNDDNYFFDATKTKASTYLLCLFVVLLISMAFFDYKATNTPRFCTKGSQASKNSEVECLQCPEHADCHNYVMRCTDGYIQANNYSCGLNPKIITSSENFIIETLTNMHEENGNHVCFNESDHSQTDAVSQSITLSELKNLLMKRILDKGSFETQNLILQEFIKNKNNQQAYGFTYNEDTLATKVVKMSLFCQGKVFVLANKQACQTAGVAFLVLSIIVKIVLNRRRQNYIAKKIYEDLAHEIAGSDERTINVSYYKEGIVNKYKDDFNERIWTLVDQLRFNEKRINVYRDHDGLYWSQA